MYYLFLTNQEYIPLYSNKNVGFWILILKRSKNDFFFLLSLLLLLVYEGIWRSSSGNNLLKSDSFPSRNKDNQSQPTQPSLEDSVIPTKALTTTGKGRVKD